MTPPVSADQQTERAALRDEIASAICPGDYCESHSECVRDAEFVLTRPRMAALLTAAVGPGQVEAVAFARWIVSLDDDDPESPGRQDRRTVTLTQIVNRARAALDGDATTGGTATPPRAGRR